MEILKKSRCVQFPADKAVDFVAHGFPAGGAEMERHLISGVADFLHQGRRRCVLGGWSVAASVTGRGMVLPSLLVLSLPSGAGMVLVIVMLGSLVIDSPFIVHQS